MSDKPSTEQPEPGFDGKDTVWLAEPVSAYGDQLVKLVFRKPNGADQRKCGFPFIFTVDGDMKVDPSSVFKFAERLANVPASTIDALSIEDANAVQAAVLSFFGGTTSPKTSSIGTTTSPGAGVETLNTSSRSTLTNSSILSDRRSA